MNILMSLSTCMIIYDFNSRQMVNVCKIRGRWFLLSSTLCNVKMTKWGLAKRKWGRKRGGTTCSIWASLSVCICAVMSSPSGTEHCGGRQSHSAAEMLHLCCICAQSHLGNIQKYHKFLCTTPQTDGYWCRIFTHYTVETNISLKETCENMQIVFCFCSFGSALVCVCVRCSVL